MAKYGTGELVRFKASELLVSAGIGSINIRTENLVGMITGSVETTGEETKYYVEVKLPAGTFVGVSGVVLKLTVLECQIQSLKEHFDEFIERVIPSPNRYFIDVDFASFKPSKEALDSLREFARTVNVHHADGLPAEGDSFAEPSIDACIKFVESGLVFKKMSKSRCVKLLESYRAEREKVKKGRKFERRLRNSVVDAALERAIELLKE